MDRRKMLKIGIGAITASAGFGAMSRAVASACGLTPAQTEGPFYPVNTQLDVDYDLTQIKGSSKVAIGEIIYVKGVVRDLDCNPIESALVEIWQANHYGKYDHPGDSNPASFDPDFQYWGQVITNSSGEYLFKTIIPGEYPAAPSWIRPPHIHFKVTKVGYHELTTQMYFKDNIYNDDDLILQSLTASEQSQVVIALKDQVISSDPGAMTANFDLTLLKVKGA